MTTNMPLNNNLSLKQKFSKSYKKWDLMSLNKTHNTDFSNHYQDKMINL